MPDREKVINGLERISEWLFHQYQVVYDGDAPNYYDSYKTVDDALVLLKEQSERIAIMRESMETIERRLAAAECQPIAVKSTDQMVYVGWMHEDQKLGLSEEEEYAEKNLRPMLHGDPRGADDGAGRTDPAENQR